MVQYLEKRRGEKQEIKIETVPKAETAQEVSNSEEIILLEEEVITITPEHVEVVTLVNVGPEEDLREEIVCPIEYQVERTESPHNQEITPDDICLVSQILDEDEDEEERAGLDAFLWEVPSKWLL